MDKNSLLKGLSAALLLTASGSAPAAVSYFNDFSGPSDGKWSNYTTYTTTQATPNSVLGRFAGTGTGTGSTLSLTGLDSHSSVTVEFDLYLFDTWDRHYTGTQASPGAVNPYWSPDIVNVTANGTQYASLSYEYASYPYSNTLTGATYTPVSSGQYGGNPQWNNLATDRIFHITLTFSDLAPNLNLSFATTSNSGLSDESYGIDNVRVSTVVSAPSSMLLLGLGVVMAARRRYRANSGHSGMQAMAA